MTDSVAPLEVLLRELERRNQTIKFWEQCCARLIATGGAGPAWDVEVASMSSAHCFGHVCDLSDLVKHVKPEQT